MSLDALQSLKQVLTGDPIDIERKNQDDYSIKPACIVLLNCNEAPSILGTQRAIETRYAIVKFGKTFTSDPKTPNELPADPRFKNDPEFLQNHVCPALLNRLLSALGELMADGIDYGPLQQAIQDAKESSCHLIRWATDIKLETGDGRIKLGDLYNSLKNWYVDQGILEIETPNGNEKLVWLDEGSKWDAWVKAPRLMRQAISKIFPRATFSEKTEHGFFVLGLQSPFFVISPNFASFASGEEGNIEGKRVLIAEPNPEPNNFASASAICFSPNAILNQNGDPEPNFYQPEPKKADNHAISEPKCHPEPNLQVAKTTANYFDENERLASLDRLKVGDKVRINNLREAFKRFPKLDLHTLDVLYDVVSINGDQVGIRGKCRLTVPKDWLVIPVWEVAV